MSKILNLFLILIVLITISEGQKYFEIILDRIEILQEDKSFTEMYAKVKKVNKTRSIYGWMYYHVPIGNDIKIGLKLLKKQGGEYRYLPYSIPPGPLCDVLGNDKFIYPDITKCSDFPADIIEKCPLPAVSMDAIKIKCLIFKGNYTINGLILDFENAPKIIAQSGEYCGELIYYKDDQKTAIYRGYAYVNNV